MTCSDRYAPDFAGIVEKRILSELRFDNVNLTLVLRKSGRLKALADNPRVTIIEGDITDFETIYQAIKAQDLVYISNVDITPNSCITKNVIKAMYF